jgi:DNA polymerase delta subunit 1
VTDHGREMIAQTKSAVESYEPTSRVIYGDTDSVMIKFPEGTSLEYAFNRGKELAKEVTKLFPSEVSLEFEKVFQPSVFYIKKNYAGLKWTDLNEEPEFSVKGLAPVRGDKIPFVKNLCSDVLKTLLYQNDAPAAIAKIQAALDDMLNGRVDASQFVQEKKLTKQVDLYQNAVHANVARAIARRDPAAAPQAGEIISYFVVESGRKGVTAVDCLHFYESKKYRLNMLYYLENLVRDTVGKLIDLPGLCSDVDALFEPYLRRARAKALGATSLQNFFTESDPVSCEETNTENVADEEDETYDF